jgi:hypothetical protein
VACGEAALTDIFVMVAAIIIATIIGFVNAVRGRPAGEHVVRVAPVVPAFSGAYEIVRSTMFQSVQKREECHAS